MKIVYTYHFLKKKKKKRNRTVTMTLPKQMINIIQQKKNDKYYLGNEL